jgi:hypothetical protein
MDANARLALQRLRDRVSRGALRLANAVKAQLTFAEECLEALLQSDGLPAKFNSALSGAIKNSRVTRKTLAARVGLPKATVGDWCRGKTVPDVRQEIFVRRIEKVLKIRRGALVKRIKRKRRGTGRLPEYIVPHDLRGDEHASLRKRIAGLLPLDLYEKDEDEQHRIFNQARSRCEREAPELSSQSKLTSEPYACNDFNRTLKAQIEAMCDYTPEIIPGSGIPAKKPWSASTRKFVRRDIAKILGFATGERAGGHRIAPEDATLAIVANRDLVHAAFNFRIDRKEKAKRGRTATECDANSFGRWANQFGDDGWIRQSSEIRAELGFAKRMEEWHVFCDALESAYAKDAKRTRKGATSTRPRRDLVKSALRLKEPESATKLLLEGLEADLAEEDDKRARAEIRQDIVYVHLQRKAPARPFTTVQLEYRADGSGHINLDGRRVVMDVPKELYKNEDSPALENDFQCELEDVWGFREHFRKFVEEDRFELLDIDSPYLFNFSPSNLQYAVEATDDELRFEPLAAALLHRVKKISRRHLRWNPAAGTGIEGVDYLTPTSFRHIGATSAIKRSGDPQQAADLLADTVEVTAEYYAEWLVSDRAHALSATKQAAAKAAETGARRLRRIASRAKRTANRSRRSDNSKRGAAATGCRRARDVRGVRQRNRGTA